MTLYKYVIAQRIDILMNGMIRFTQSKALNDPWEMRPYIERIIEDQLFENEIASKARVLDEKTLARLAAEKIWKAFPRKQRRSLPLMKIETQILQLMRNNPEEFKTRYASAYSKKKEKTFGLRLEPI